MFSVSYHCRYRITMLVLNFFNSLWWKRVPGTTIKLKWPLDLNHIRCWLEKNVGKQGWDWDWTPSVDKNLQEKIITIKFRKGKEEYSVMAVLLWS